VSATAVSRWIIDTDVDAKTTMGRMARDCRRAMQEPGVIYAANEVIDGTPARAYPVQIEAIRRFMDSYFKFIPNPIGTQTIRPPGWTNNPRCPGMLEDIESTGMAEGACDDAAVLVATLGMANGMPARFRALAFCDDTGVCSPTDPYTHVIADLFDGDRWVMLDVTRPHDLTRPRQISRMLTYDVGS
jgi:hypothetical protein